MKSNVHAKCLWLARLQEQISFPVMHCFVGAGCPREWVGDYQWPVVELSTCHLFFFLFFFYGVRLIFPFVHLYARICMNKKGFCLCDMRRVGVQMEEALTMVLQDTHWRKPTVETIAIVPLSIQWCHNSALPWASYRVSDQHPWLHFSSQFCKNYNPWMNTHTNALFWN